MRVISNRRLREFAAIHPTAEAPLQAWRYVMEHNSFPNFAALKALFPNVDKVGDLYVFNIGGNKFRLITSIDFPGQQCFIKHVLTHVEYDKGGWK